MTTDDEFFTFNEELEHLELDYYAPELGKKILKLSNLKTLKLFRLNPTDVMIDVITMKNLEELEIIMTGEFEDSDRYEHVLRSIRHTNLKNLKITCLDQYDVTKDMIMCVLNNNMHIFALEFIGSIVDYTHDFMDNIQATNIQDLYIVNIHEFEPLRSLSKLSSCVITSENENKRRNVVIELFDNDIATVVNKYIFE